MGIKAARRAPESDGTGRSSPSKRARRDADDASADDASVDDASAAAAEASPDCTEPEKQRLRLVKHDLLERLQAASTREEAQRILEEDVPEELKSEDVFVQLVSKHVHCPCSPL